jgi:hypothetical protein
MSDTNCLCDWDKKDIEKRLHVVMSMVHRPKYVCRKCARAANEKEYVCKPVEIVVDK